MGDYEVREVCETLSRVWQEGNGSSMKNRHTNGIVICDDSEFSFFCKGKEIKASKSRVLFLPKGAEYSFICRKSGLTYTYNFNGTLPHSEPYCIETTENSRLLALACEMQKAGGEFTKMGLMYGILGLIFDKQSFSSVPDIIRPQVEYIHREYARCDLSNSDLAAMTNISEVYLRKLFAKHFGVSVHTYVTDVRTENAKRLLTQGKNASETASECGFSSLYYFSAAFKKRVGVSPSVYAKKQGFI